MRMTDPRDAYVASTAEIHANLARLQQLADDHFAHDPETIHWGHVGVVASGSEIAQRQGLHHYGQ